MKILQILSTVLTISALLSGRAAASPVLLNCSITCAGNLGCPGNAVLNETLQIDMSSRTVMMTGETYPVEVNQTFIKWDTGKYGGVYTVNRSTLVLSYIAFNTEDGTDATIDSPLFQGPCHKGSIQI